MFDKFKINRSVNKVIEDKYYEQVAIEMSEGRINVGTWTRAKANAEGDENKTEALYIKYRVQSLHDEIHVISTLNKELGKKNKEIHHATNRQVPEKKETITAAQIIRVIAPFTSKDLSFAKSAILQGDINYIKINSSDYPSKAINQLIEYSDLCGEYGIFTYLTSLSKFNREPINADVHHVEGITSTEELVTLIEDSTSLKHLEQSLVNLTKEESLSIINSADACDEYPLHVAVKNKRLDIVVLLLKKGANKDLLNGWERTPLDMAIKLEVPTIIRVLKY